MRSEKMDLLFDIFVAVLLGSVLVGSVEGDTHYYDFVLENKNFTRLCITKSAMVVNGTIPGPTIYVHKGDTAFVNVHNYGYYGVTIHWHGIKQPRNPWFDGTEFITQCAIPPGSNFTYEVIFSDEVGTLWWHAHSDWTRNTVHGAIVVYPEGDSSYPYTPKPDAEEIIVLGSWYTYEVNLKVLEDLATGEDLPDSDAYTINGQPGDFCNCSKDSTYRWRVDYGKTYLLRLVNAIMNAEVFFAISGHKLTVVGSDGAYLKPIVTDYIEIGPGQTMDILVATDQTPGRYYVAARQYYSGDIIYDEYDQVNVTAILEYNGDYTATSPSFPTQLPGYTDKNAAITFRNQMRSLNTSSVPKNISTSMFITTEQNQLVSNKSGHSAVSISASMNNVSFVNPTTDILQAYYYNMSGFYTEDFPDMPPSFYNFTADDLGMNSQSTRGTKVKVLEYGEEVEIVFQNSNLLNASEDHPMHLHGNSFYVVGSGGGNFDFEEDPKTYNLVDPPYVNTGILPRDSWLAVRFKALNPGVWLWHCHLDRHLSYGMDTAFIVKNGGTPETTMRGPPAYMPKCDDSTKIRLFKSDPTGYHERVN